MENSYYKFISFIISMIIIATFSISAPIAYAKDINLKSPQKIVNEAIEIENMFPGDTYSKEFNVNLEHKDWVLLHFKSTIKEDDKNLANALNIKIEITNKNEILFDGAMTNMPENLTFKLKPNDNSQIYKITLSLDTSVGNEYQFAKLVADFVWWYEPYEEPTTMPEQTTPNSELDTDADADNNEKFPWGDPFSPGTGLMYNLIVTIGASGILALIMFLIIILIKNRKKKDEEKQ